LDGNHFPLSDDEFEALRQSDSEIDPPSVDVQAAISVIGRRSERQREFERSHRKAPTDSERDAWRLDLTACHLAGANFVGLDFAAARFDFSTLCRANFINACLEGATFENVHLEMAEFRGARLREVQFDKTHLENARFDDAHLENAWLIRADIRGANFAEAHLGGANLQECRLEGARFARAHLEGASLDDLNLEGAKLQTSLNRSGLIGGCFV
jgi:uncharacterized protein YjbI with pentapeptide repeats